jgi:hypothetical protein
LLRVDPERRFFTPPSKAGLGAAEWVNKNCENMNIKGRDGEQLHEYSLRDNPKSSQRLLKVLHQVVDFWIRSFIG